MKWISTTEALEALGISRQKLRELQAVTAAAGVEPAWADIGQPGRPEYRWDSVNLSTWFRGVCAWRASSGEERLTKSAGEREESPAPRPRRTSERRRSSSGRSSGASRSVVGGNLVALAKS